MKRMLALLLALLTVLLCACAPKEEASQEVPEQTETVDAQEETTPAEETVPEETQPDYSHINELEPDADGVYQVHSPAGLANMAKHPDGKFTLLCNIDMEIGRAHV